MEELGGWNPPHQRGGKKRRRKKMKSSLAESHWSQACMISSNKWALNTDWNISNQ